MAYITQYNFKRISNLLDAKKIINKDNIDSILLCEDLPAIKFGYLNKIEKLLGYMNNYTYLCQSIVNSQ